MNGQGPELAINPGLVIQRQPIAGGQDCLVIDDFLADPDAAVAWAAQHTQDFVAPERSYPGRLLPIDEAAARPLHEFVRSRLSREFGFLRGDLDLYTQYSIATLQPADFSWIQALPHSDPQTAPGRANYAALLYLFHDPALGGTGFYRWRDPDYWSRMSELQRDDPAAGLYELRERFELFRGPLAYPADSNEVVERLTLVPPRWNRLICYSGQLPPSACTPAPGRLNPDPRRGRLTLICFASVWPKTDGKTRHQ